MSLQSAYESKILLGINTSSIALEFAKANVGAGKHEEIIPNVYYITENDNVDPFPYPLYDKDNGKVLVDSRPYTSVARDGKVKVRNDMDDSLFKLLAQLEYVWVTANRYDYIYNAFRYSQEVYVRWLSETIGHKYGLGPDSLLKLKIITSMFAIGQFFNNVTDPLSQSKYIQTISRELGVPIHTVQTIAETLDNSYPRDVTEFIEAIHKVDLGPRLSDFNTKALYALMTSAWWATTNSQYVTSVALEYPPAFAALVHSAVENKFFKRTGIGNRVESMQRGGSHDNFKRAIRLLVDQYAIK